MTATWTSLDTRAKVIVDTASWSLFGDVDRRIGYEYSLWVDGECVYHDDDLFGRHDSTEAEQLRALASFLTAWAEASSDRSDNADLFPADAEPFLAWVDEFHIHQQEVPNE